MNKTPDSLLSATPDSATPPPLPPVMPTKPAVWVNAAKAAQATPDSATPPPLPPVMPTKPAVWVNAAKAAQATPDSATPPPLPPSHNVRTPARQTPLAMPAKPAAVKHVNNVVPAPFGKAVEAKPRKKKRKQPLFGRKVMLEPGEQRQESLVSRRDALWSCIFCGVFGVHRGQTGRFGGVFVTIMFLILAALSSFIFPPLGAMIALGIVVWWVVDLVQILKHTYRDGAGLPLFEGDDGTYCSREVCTDLCLFWGQCGVHRYYLKRYRSAIVMSSLMALLFVAPLAESILRKIIGFLLSFFFDNDAGDTGSDVLAKLVMLVILFVLGPMLAGGIMWLLILVYIGVAAYVYVSIWAIIDLIRCLFFDFPNAAGHPLVGDEDELYSLRLAAREAKSNAAMGAGIVAKAGAAVSSVTPGIGLAASHRPIKRGAKTRVGVSMRP